MNRLTEIANKYNTDKGTCTSCDNGAPGHGFTKFYYDYVTLFSNDDKICPKTIGNLRRNRSLTAIIRLHQDAEA